ncbi:MAM and LDL-receptor class A domain-containing protein 2-like [Tigriopus californicus]|uniref:MAM and LDL-receptor class A domain-containing protein 2-like n=1 Tax=Tigriopus californicus TaxID=6832 RepID=UPI0027DAB52E|nr:MAM and LDL-receptor class A domain-containing protein 2-like [Tigriopus californicus]
MVVDNETPEIVGPSFVYDGFACLQLFYLGYSKFPATIKLNLNYTDQETVHSLYGTTSNKIQNGSRFDWRLIQGTTFDDHDKFQVSISVTNSEDDASGSNEVIMDDLRILPGACPDENNCNFESGTTCSYQSIGEEDWIVADGDSHINYGGPTFDHTTASADGHFAFMRQGPNLSGENAKAVLSSLPKAIQSGEKCIEFYLQLTGGYLRVVLRDFYSDREIPLWIWREDTTDDSLPFNGWMYGRVPYSTQEFDEYTIEFQTDIFTNTPGGMAALDDIIQTEDTCILMPDEANPNTPTTIPSTPRTTSTTTTEPSGTNHLSCDFEDGTPCHWTNSQTDSSQFLIGPAELVPLGPNVDHSTGEKSGLLAYADLTNVTKITTLSLNSPDLALEDLPICIRVWYHFYGEQLGTLTMHLVDSEEPMIIWTESQSVIDQWKFQQVTLNEALSEPFHISIRASVRPKATGYICLDDLQIEPGPCEYSAQDHLCEFDGDLCTFHNTADEEVKLKWASHFSFEGEHEKFPTGRPTFLYVDVPHDEDGHVAHETAVLVSQPFNASRSYCLDLYYHMNGALGSLNVSQVVEIEGGDDVVNEVFNVKTDQGSNWKHHLAQILPFESTSDVFRLEISAQISDQALENAAVIALDHLNMIESTCPTKGSCSFEKNEYCSWVIEESESGFHWMVGHALDMNEWDRPDKDHTEGYLQGGYLFVDVTKAEPGNKAIIRTTMSGNHVSCFSFWIRTRSGPSLGSLAAFYTTEGSADLQVLWEDSDPNYPEDSWHLVLIDYALSKDHDIVLQLTVGESPEGGHIAIDDLGFADNSQCPETGTSTMTTISTTPVPTVDPYSPYSCNFEDGTMCQWSQDTTDNGNFSIVYKENLGNYLGMNFTDLFLGGAMRVISPEVSASSGDCLRFGMNQVGSQPGTLIAKARFVGSGRERLIFKSHHDTTSWQAHFIPIAFEEVFEIIFEAHKLEFDANAELGLDDFAIASGTCKENPLGCDFENANLCGFFQETDNDLDWVWANDQGPHVDHTLDTQDGHFMLLDGTTATSIGSKATLVSKYFESDAVTHGQLWYSLEGPGIIQILVQSSENDPELIWSISGQEDDETWNALEFDLRPFIPHFSILFRGVLAKPGNFYVALDDFKLVNDNHDDPGGCSLAHDLCLWTNIKRTGDNSNWLWMNGSMVLGKSTEAPWSNATLKSIELPATVSRCLSFNVDLPGQGDLAIILKTASSEEIIWMLGGNVGSKISAAISFSSPVGNYRILFKGTMESAQERDIKVNAIKFTDISCQVSPPEAKPGNYHPPTTPHPLPTTSVSFDNEGDCNFEDDLCSWGPMSDDEYRPWTRVNGSELAPNVDHTLDNAQGYYIVARDSEGQQQKGLPFGILGPNLTEQSCLRFWYFVDGPQAGQLAVFANDFDSSSRRNFFTREGSQRAKWLEAKMQIPMAEDNTNSAYSIEAIPGDPGTNVIAIDDVRITPSQCPKHESNSFYLCTAEQWEDYCGYSFGAEASFKWIPGKGSHFNDHTLQTKFGSIFEANLADARENDTLAVMKTPHFDDPGVDKTCLHFYYRVFVPHGTNDQGITSFRILMIEDNDAVPIETTIFERALPTITTPGWVPAEAQIPSSTEFRLQFEVKSIKPSSITVGLDDLKIELNECSLIKCTFESDLCEWEQDETDDDTNWLLHSAMDLEGGFGPPVDHSSQSGQGHYLIVTDENADVNQKRSIARLRSSPQSGGPNVNFICLSLWYYLHGSKPGLLRVSEASGSNSVTRWEVTEGEVEGWSMGTVSAASDLNTVFQFVIEAELHDDAQGFIALDDVEISSSECPGGNKVSPKYAEPQFSAKYHVSCSFDENFCDWNVTSFGIPTGPNENDPCAPDNSDEGLYLLLSGKNATGDLVSGRAGPKIDSDDGSVCLKLAFSAFGSTSVQMQVFRESWNQNRDEGGLLLYNFYGNTPDSWTHTSIPVHTSSDSDWRIKITGENSGDFGDLAIGAIDYHSDECEDRTLCDFEEGRLCQWESDEDSDLQWRLSPAKDFAYPDGRSLVDHTTNTGQGHVLATNWTGSAGDRSVLYRTFPKNFGTQCLSFYLFDLTDASTTLKVSSKIVGNSTYKTLWTHHGGFERPQWRLVQVDVAEEEPFDVRHFWVWQLSN